jgi:hypothetical protein
LLKRNGEGDYIRLAPVLFAKPNAMSADDFLKSPVLVKVCTHDNVHCWKYDAY